MSTNTRTTVDNSTTKSTPQQKAARTRSQQLTAKEVKFLKGLAAGKTKVQAAMEAYPNASYNTAAAMATENLNKPKLKNALEAAYEAAGITPQALADVFSDAMLAKKSYQDNGQLVESNLADHGVRVGAARTAALLLINSEKAGDGGNGPTIQFNVNSTQNYIKQVDVKP